MTRKEIAEHFAYNIEIERNKLGYTQAQMAKALDMSLSSYKNIINGISNNIPLYVAFLAYQLTGRYFIEMCNITSPELELIQNFRNIPKYRRKAILSYTDLETKISADTYNNYDISSADEDDITVLYIPTGDMQDGMYYDSKNIEPINVAKYKKICSDNIDCCIKITSNHLHPAYNKDDILLISKQPLRNGDIGIFINIPTRKMYIRKFKQSANYVLEPITGYGKKITIDDNDPRDMNNWIFFGRVLMKMR